MILKLCIRLAKTSTLNESKIQAFDIIIGDVRNDFTEDSVSSLVYYVQKRDLIEEVYKHTYLVSFTILQSISFDSVIDQSK